MVSKPFENASFRKRFLMWKGENRSFENGDDKHIKHVAGTKKNEKR